MSEKDPSVESFRDETPEMTLELSPDEPTTITKDSAGGSVSNMPDEKEEEKEEATGIFRDLKSSRVKLFIFAGVVVVAAIATAVAVPLSMKGKKSRSLCTPNQVQDLKDTKVTITIDGLNRVITESEKAEIEKAVARAYNEVSGGCDDVYNRWMYDSWLVDQEIHDGGLAVNVLTTVSCNGCPPDETFASIFTEAAEDVLDVRRLRHDRMLGGTKTIDAAEFIAALQQEMIGITEEATAISKVDFVSEANPDTEYSASVVACSAGVPDSGSGSGKTPKSSKSPKSEGSSKSPKSEGSSKSPKSSKTPGGSSSKSPKSSKTPGGSSSKSPKSSKTPGGSSSRSPKSSKTPGEGSSKSPKSSKTPSEGSSKSPKSSKTPGGSSSKSPKSSKTPGEGSSKSPKSSKTPKSEGSSKSPKSSKTPSEGSSKTPKSSKTPSDGKTPKSSKAPKSSKTPKSAKKGGGSSPGSPQRVEVVLCQTVEAPEKIAPASGSSKAPKSGSSKSPKSDSSKTPKSGSSKAPKSGSSKAPKSDSSKAPKSDSSKAPKSGSSKAPKSGSGKSSKKVACPCDGIESVGTNETASALIYAGVVDVDDPSVCEVEDSGVSEVFLVSLVTGGSAVVKKTPGDPNTFFCEDTISGQSKQIYYSQYLSCKGILEDVCEANVECPCFGAEEAKSFQTSSGITGCVTNGVGQERRVFPPITRRLEGQHRQLPEPAFDRYQVNFMDKTCEIDTIGDEETKLVHLTDAEVAACSYVLNIPESCVPCVGTEFDACFNP